MTRSLAVGEEAPNFDLTSTEDVVLMLRDEVVRTAIVLYVFADSSTERVRADLLALARVRDRLAARHGRILGLSKASLEELKAVQKELRLPYPLLHDDRDFTTAYGVGEEGAGSALFLIDREQRLAWQAVPAGSVDEALGTVEGQLQALPSPSRGLPRNVVNRLVDRWVN